MSNDVTCPNCDQHWVVVLSTMKAHPGQTVTRSATVPIEDVYGGKHGTKTTMTGRWVAAGPSVTLAVSADATAVQYLWPCRCGEPLQWSEVALTHVECKPGGHLCRVAKIKAKPPLDLYVNPSHGQACPCCGHAGYHVIPADGTGTPPACVSGWDGSWSTRPR